jgi:hypothetical protein
MSLKGPLRRFTHAVVCCIFPPAAPDVRMALIISNLKAVDPERQAGSPEWLAMVSGSVTGVDAAAAARIGVAPLAIQFRPVVEKREQKARKFLIREAARTSPHRVSRKASAVISSALPVFPATSRMAVGTSANWRTDALTTVFCSR